MENEQEDLKSFEIDYLGSAEFDITEGIKDLVSNIKLEIIKILFTIQLQSKEEQEALDKVKANMEKSNEHITTNLAQEAVKSSEKKISRNEVCPCGSGLKYKQCCGKSGPKRGLVAGI